MVTPSIALLYASTVLLVLLAAYAHRKAHVPGARPFQILLLCIAVWSAGYAVALGTFERGPRLFWRNVQWFGIAFVPSAWVVFALEYTGREAWVTRRSIVALSVVPVATIAVSWLAPELMWQNSQIDPTAGMAIVTRLFGPWYWVNLAFAYVAFVVGTVFVLGLVLTRSSLYLDQAVSLLVGSVVAWVGNVVSNFRLGPIPMDYTPFAFTITAILFGHAVFRYRMLDSIPASLRIGREATVEELDEGVVVLDPDRRVIDANEVAAVALGVDGSGLVGEPFDDVAPDSVADLEDPGLVEVDAADRRRRFEVDVTATTDRRDRRVGWIVLFREVTVRHAYEERLTVVNRILRHNVRNEMTVVGGNAASLADELDDPDQHRKARLIQGAADDLTALAEKARQADAVLGGIPERQSIDLVPLLEGVVADVAAEFPEGRIEATLPDSLSATAVPEIEHALRMVVENAIEHGDADEPRAWVEADRTEAGVRVRVADDGPGIPAHEREVLTRGAESPLEHGSGLGLWLVQWAVRASGGDLRFEENEPRGSVVTMTLPPASSADA